MSNLVLLKKVSNLFEAQAIRSYLYSHNIIAYIPDESTISTNWQLQIAIGYCRILVQKEDYDTADSLLKHIDDKNESKPKEISDNKIITFFKNVISIIIIYIIGIPIIFKKKQKNE